VPRERYLTLPAFYDLYDLMAGAILTRKPVVCTYHGARREVCPIMLGRKNGAACVLTWQFAGTNEQGDPVTGDWNCLPLDEVSDVRVHDGPWYDGDSAPRPHARLDDVDLDAAHPDRPRRKV